ncbi:MAG: hypothetical protein A2Y12_02610 [Planctomycetes bacterium GWF2_42_9]|nr:MAG: hypothetical protein A2Y12_02610 [Planctomycetes bacterium GWF2_42_9]
MKQTKGFTLVELLVVISIIALLLSILMPSLNKARMSAQRVVCMHNVKQMHLAAFAQATDAKGKFPSHSTVPWLVRDALSLDSAGQEIEQVYNALKPYIAEGKLFQCGVIRKFAKESPNDWGMCADSKWYTAFYGGANDKGGWDSVRPNTSPKQLPRFIGVPYAWYANYRYYGALPSTYHNGAKPFATQTAEGTSTSPFISHLFMCDKGPTKFRDYGHGGSTMKWNPIMRPDAPPTLLKTQDNPVGWADGHVTYVKSKDIRLRVVYPGNQVQLAW